MENKKLFNLSKSKAYTASEALTWIFEYHSLAEIMAKTNYLYPTVAMYKSKWKGGGMTQSMMFKILDRWGFEKVEPKVKPVTKFKLK